MISSSSWRRNSRASASTRREPAADAASALIAKWCAHYNSTAPLGLSESAQGYPEVVDLTQETGPALEAGPAADGLRAEAPAARGASVTFEDDESPAEGGEKAKGTARVSKIAQAPSVEPARQ